ncbi:TIR domain-containing protein [Salmonella enterica]|uniref:TIR domain-containing protein n=1 Tax=Salmonella enterica TaxID=28901 RepID=UPI000DA396D3|nr:nucleotide-binding protein [Salmonella enterica]EAB9843035.1 DNA-binding protein [Salmonella enterica subsp. enterica serovar Carmel]SQH83269.1 Predicted nucleotide-binding protein containing TIR-like domain [Salmonella enterica subsp. enterica serovar Carmel]
MFYNTIIEVSDKDKKGNNFRHYDLDNIDLDDVKKHIIYPFLKKETIFIDGRYIEASKINMIKIKQSDKKTSALRDIANASVPRGVFMAYSRINVLNDTYTTDITKQVLTDAGEFIASSQREKIDASIKNTTNPDNTSVFIVHGRDDLAKTEVARFIEQLGLKAIILHEQDNGGKTIIEKIEEYTNVGYGIVLYTPCDIGSLGNDKNLKPRSRQNVVFEHGYLIGKLGRNKVSALVKAQVEIPSDLNGLVYTELDKAGGWKLSIAKELTREGYSIDLNKALL